MIMRIICCMILVIDIEEGLAEKICSKGTDKTVKFCPQNERMWIKASKRKNCTQFMTKDCVDLQYHCVLNAYGNGTVEVCAKLTYLQGFCAEYNTLTNSIQNYYLLPCMNFTNGRCPSRYKSTEAYKYQECFKFLKRPNLNSNRTSKHYHLSHGQGSIDTAMIIILIVLSLCVSVCFMIYLVNYYHRSINEDADIPEEMKTLLEDGSHTHDSEPGNYKEEDLRKAVLSEISKLKDVFVTEEDKLISEEEITELAPKLQDLVERLNWLRSFSVPEIIFINLKKFNNLISPHKPKTITSKYIKMVTDFTLTLDKIEEEVHREFQNLATVIRIEEEFLTVNYERSFGERVNDLEGKVIKLEEMNKIV